jgi:hypothetical protein
MPLILDFPLFPGILRKEEEIIAGRGLGLTDGNKKENHGSEGTSEKCIGDGSLHSWQQIF